MQQNNDLLKDHAQYPLVALGTAMLLFIVASAAHTALGTMPLDRLIGNLHNLAAIFDVKVAAAMSAASVVIFVGLWSLAPQSRRGVWTLRLAVALLVALDWAAWVIALWWH